MQGHSRATSGREPVSCPGCHVGIWAIVAQILGGWSAVCERNRPVITQEDAGTRESGGKTIKSGTLPHRTQTKPRKPWCWSRLWLLVIRPFQSARNSSLTSPFRAGSAARLPLNRVEGSERMLSNARRS